MPCASLFRSCRKQLSRHCRKRIPLFASIRPREENFRILLGTITLHHLRNMRLLEPKLFYANERTFIHYVKRGLVALLLCTILPYTKSPVLRAALFASGPALVTYFFWCYLVFEQRCHVLASMVAVSRKDYRVDVQAGPGIVFGCTLVVTLSTLGVYSFVDT